MSPLDENDVKHNIEDLKPPHYKSHYSYAVKFLCGYVMETRLNNNPNVVNGEVVPLTALPILRPGIYATDINIYNPQGIQAILHKLFIPLIQRNGDITTEYREREQNKHTNFEDMILEPLHATFDDCQKFCELSGGKPGNNYPLTIGYFEIQSNVKIVVTAVYTVNDVRGITTSLDVERIEGMEIQDKIIWPEVK